MKGTLFAATLLLTLLLPACNGAGQDLDTLTTPGGEQAPDLTGSYDAALTRTSGCEEAPPPDFITGALEVTGPPGALAFAFEEGVVLAGTVDEAFTVLLSGEIAVEGFALSVSGEGLAYIDADRWVLEIDLEMNAVGEGGSGTACDRIGVLEAKQTGVAQ